MAPPSRLAIATGSVLRLVKEEASYHNEAAHQEQRIKKLEESEGDSNKEYTLKQEAGHLYHASLAETRNVLPSMQAKISAALAKLEEALKHIDEDQEAHEEGGADASAEDVAKAKDAIAKGKEAVHKSS
ncbi:tubulin folding cofactor A [Pleosporales sp. CAS-2024a]